MLAGVYMEWNEERGKWIVSAKHERYENDERVHVLQQDYEIAVCDDAIALVALMDLMGYEVCDNRYLKYDDLVKIDLSED